MVIKDFMCRSCGREVDGLVVESCCVSELECKCGSQMEACANGGTGKRVRVFDVHPEAHRDVRILKSTCSYDSTDGDPVVDNKTGETYHERREYSDEGHDERRSVLLDKRRISRTGPRLFLDGKAGVTSTPRGA